MCCWGVASPARAISRRIPVKPSPSNHTQLSTHIHIGMVTADTSVDRQMAELVFCTSSCVREKPNTFRPQGVAAISINTARGVPLIPIIMQVTNTSTGMISSFAKVIPTASILGRRR